MRKGVLLTLTLCLFAATVCAVAESVDTDREPGTWLLAVGNLLPVDGDDGEAAVAVCTLSICLIPGQGTEGVTGPRGQVGAVLFSVTLPSSWKLCDVSPGGGAQDATVTVSERAGEGTWYILVDGSMELAGGGELVVLTVKVPSAGEASGGTVTVCPASDSPYIYYLEGNGRMTAIPLAGCTTKICPRRTQQTTDPAESGAESETGTKTETEEETETEVETVPVTDKEEETETEAEPEPECPSGAVYVGCQEADCGEGLFSVRFLFLVPKNGAGQGSGAVWVNGGGTATLSVSTAAGVTAREGRKTAVTEPEEGYLFCMMTYTGLRMAGRYTFTVDTGQGLIRILYEEGEYGGLIR
ncbi:MAG: hypothetical protein ACI4WV_07220 [Eubacteriales bacterium]